MKVFLKINSNSILFEDWWDNLIRDVGSFRVPVSHHLNSDSLYNFYWALEMEELVKDYGLLINWEISKTLITLQGKLIFENPENRKILEKREVKEFFRNKNMFSVCVRSFSNNQSLYLQTDTTTECKDSKIQNIKKAIITQHCYGKLNYSISLEKIGFENLFMGRSYIGESVQTKLPMPTSYLIPPWLNIVEKAFRRNSEEEQGNISKLFYDLNLRSIVFKAEDTNEFKYHIMIFEGEPYEAPPFVASFFDLGFIPPLTHMFKGPLYSYEDVDWKFIEKEKKLLNKKIKTKEKVIHQKMDNLLKL